MCWEAKTPLVIETVEVAPPKAGEVRIKVLVERTMHSTKVTAHQECKECCHVTVHVISLAYELKGIPVPSYLNEVPLACFGICCYH